MEGEASTWINEITGLGTEQSLCKWGFFPLKILSSLSRFFLVSPQAHPVYKTLPHLFPHLLHPRPPWGRWSPKVGEIEGQEMEVSCPRLAVRQWGGGAGAGRQA